MNRPGDSETPSWSVCYWKVHDVVRGRRGVSADTAMRLARYFGGDARSWLNLQTAHDLRVAEISNAKRVAREVSPATT